MPKLTARDIRSRVNWALRKTAAESGEIKAPIDLKAVCDTLGIRVEFRPMIPEGVLSADESGLCIYLQSNFLDELSGRRRRRFTWAHEISHALFYETGKIPPQLIPGTPDGAHLERLCQMGGGLLLMPDVLVARNFNRISRVKSVRDVELLSQTYDTSDDAVIRRVHELAVVGDDNAILLIRQINGKSRIDAAAYGSSVPTVFTGTPNIGEDFDGWAGIDFSFSGAQENTTTLTRDTSRAYVTMMRKSRSSASQFVEIAIDWKVAGHTSLQKQESSRMPL